MGTIGKIRQRSGLVIGVIGVSMLLFIATDLFTNNRLFNGKSGLPKGIGSVYGNEISPAEFESKYNLALYNKRKQAGDDEEISATDKNGVNEQVWGQLVQDKIMEKEYNDLGLTVSGDEIIELTFGRYIHPVAKQAFYDQGVNKNGLLNAVKHLSEQNEEIQLLWRQYEEQFSTIRLKEKYNALIKKGIYTTDLEAREEYVNKNKIASFQYVPVFLNTISDSTVKVSENELRDYYKKHLEEYKREESRTFDFVVYDINTTSRDTMAAQQWMVDKGASLQKTKSDSTFPVSDGKYYYNKAYLHHGGVTQWLKGKVEVPEAFEDKLFTMDSGKITEVINNNGRLMLAKVIGKRQDTLTAYRCSHILFKWKQDDNVPATKEDSIAAQKKVDEFMPKVKTGDFAKLAAETGDDQGAKAKGGDLGWFVKGTMVNDFYQAAKKLRKGEVTTVKTQFGIHVIKATENPDNSAVKVGLIVKDIKPTNETVKEVQKLATAFAAKATDAAKFDETVKAMGLNKRVAENIKPGAMSVAGVDNARELIWWAYGQDTKVGTVSDVKRLGDKFVVAKLTKSFADGYAPFEDIQKDIKPFVIQEKKKEMLKAKIQTALDKNKDNMDGIAKDLSSSVSTAENVNFAQAFVANLANEQALVGYVFGSKPNKVVGPITGQNAVFVVKLNSITGGDPAKEQKFDTEKQSLQSQIVGVSENECAEALRKVADVKDFRYANRY